MGITRCVERNELVSKASIYTINDTFPASSFLPTHTASPASSPIASAPSDDSWPLPKSMFDGLGSKHVKGDGVHRKR